MNNSLNKPQLDAVKTTEGPLLVLAGAGTGKTKVLTSRIIHILSSNLALPQEILAVTFTNKAAAEMKKRIGEVIGDAINNVWVGTFHSIAAKILRRHPEIVGLRQDFTIIDDDDQTRLLKQILGDFNIDTKQFSPKSYLNKISRLKDSAKLDAINSEVFLPKLKEVYETYCFRLKSMNAADFGDLLLHNLTIFASSPEALSYYQKKFRYILIDEYQDTNNSQYQWLLRLSALHNNICCVGDDDQSIYSWRGANIANILRFEKDFKNARVIRLEQNYRSSANILKAADSVISKNKERHGKTLWTEADKGEKVKVLSFNDDRLEAASVARAIAQTIASKEFLPNHIAVLVRAGYQTRPFEEAFIQASLPYKVIGGMKFYERMEVRDSIAYLRICANPSDDLALSRIINTPKRGIGDVAISSIYARSKQERISFFYAIQKSLEENLLKGKAREALKGVVDLIEKFNAQVGSTKLCDLAKSVLNEFGYIAMWKNENSLEAQGRLENIEEFISSLSDFSSMTEFLEYVSLIEARDDKNLQDSVTIMTVHAAKGLEFDLVFLPGLEDGIFPSSKSIDERNGLEEERRLMYVAITRARHRLILSFAKSRYIFGDVQMQMPSRFLQELPQDEIEFEDVVGFGGSFENYFDNAGRQKFGGKSFTKNSSEEKFLGSYFTKTSTENQQNKFSQNRFSSSLTSTSSTARTSFPSSSTTDSMKGKRVFHQKFGYGKVLNCDDKKLEISFEKTGIKTVIKDFVSEV